MFNNRGQSLVLFVIMLPILILILVLVIDIGRVILLKQELENISNIAIEYGLDNLEQEDLVTELNELINLNNDEIDSIDIYLKDDKLYLELTDSVDGIISQFVGISIFDVNVSYVGYIENENKRIERVVGD